MSGRGLLSVHAVTSHAVHYVVPNNATEVMAAIRNRLKEVPRSFFDLLEVIAEFKADGHLVDHPEFNAEFGMGEFTSNVPNERMWPQLTAVMHISVYSFMVLVTRIETIHLAANGSIEAQSLGKAISLHGNYGACRKIRREGASDAAIAAILDLDE